MAIENLTTYTKVDTNNRYAVTSSRVTFTDITDQDPWTYLYYDKGVDYFADDFTFYVDVYLGGNNYPFLDLCRLGNYLEDYVATYTNTHSTLTAYIQATALHIIEMVNGVEYETSPLDYYIYSINTLYYVKIFRDESVGTYGTFYLKVYPTSADRIADTNVLDTLTITLHAKIDYRYIFPTGSQVRAVVGTLSGYVENLDLDPSALTGPMPSFLRT